MNLRRHILIGLSLSAVTSLVACGGGSDEPPPVVKPTTAMVVTPSLGAVYGGTVSVYSANGSLLGTATTSTTDGKANLNLTDYAAGTPVIVKLTLNTGTTYFNEKTGSNSTVSSAASLLSTVPAITANQAVGVTPLTNMAAKLAGLSSSAVGSGTLATPVTADNIYTAVAKTNLALGLPANTNILAAPVPATAAAPTPTDTLGKLLAVMAKNTTSADPLAQALALEAAVNTNGTVNTAQATVLNQVNTTLANPALNAGLSLKVAAPQLAPTTAQLNQAISDAKQAVDSGTAPTGGTGAGG